MAVDHLAELDTMMADLTEVFGVTVTLTAAAVGAYAAASGARTVTLTSQSWSVNRLPVTQDVNPAGGGEGHAVVEERRYEGQASLVSIGTPAQGWRITDGGTTLEITAVDLDADRKNYIVRARRTR